MRPPYEPRYLSGINHFNYGNFRDCHETLEDYWLEEHGPGRVFLQGLIQIATGYYKWELGVLGGAVRLLRNGLSRLEAYPGDYGGLDLAAFIPVVREHLALIEKAYHARAAPPSLVPPRLDFTTPPEPSPQAPSPGG